MGSENLRTGAWSLPPAILLVISLTLFSCGDSIDDPGGGEAGRETHRSDLDRNLAPVATAEDLSSLTRLGARFALDLFAELDEEENLLLSPLSIRLAFAMVYAGAKGETADEMAAALGYEGEQSDIHDAFNALDLALGDRNLPAGPDGEGSVELSLANSFWGRDGFPFLDDYLDRLALNYGSGVESLDYTGDPDGARRVINGWVEEKTRDRIRDLLPEGSITPSTVAVLTNALYFKAPWLLPFDKELTVDGRFTVEGGAEIQTPMMRMLDQFRYAEGEGYQALEFLFRGEELAMTLILPGEGSFDEFVNGLDADLLGGIVDDMELTQVDVSVPKFTFESEFGLKELLGKMGMVIPFTASADFTGIVSDGGIWIDEAYHKTFIAIDEKGAEAAAATAVVMVDSASPPATVTFHADRPFLFLIRDRETGCVLFYGALKDPSA